MKWAETADLVPARFSLCSRRMTLVPALTLGLAALSLSTSGGYTQGQYGGDVAIVETTPSSAAPDPLTACELARAPSLERVDTESCDRCHQVAHRRSTHPVGIDYWYAQGKSGGGMGLRTTAEVVRRGVFLPEGRIQCLTCHDPRSPWRYYIALPPGSQPTPAVNPRDPETYTDGPRRRTLLEAVRQEQLGERRAVTAKPLCLACHMAD